MKRKINWLRIAPLPLIALGIAIITLQALKWCAQQDSDPPQNVTIYWDLEPFHGFTVNATPPPGVNITRVRRGLPNQKHQR